jgi:hypothetical protein
MTMPRTNNILNKNDYSITDVDDDDAQIGTRC